MPALEVLVMDYGMANMVREGKTHMLLTGMTTGQNRGNRLLNDDLARLVRAGKISKEEAISKAVDSADLAKRIGTGA